MRANAVSPKAARHVLAHRLGVSTDREDDTSPVVLVISFEKWSIPRMNDAKNVTNKNPTRILFLSVTWVQKISTVLQWIKLPLTLPNTEGEEQLDLKVNESVRKASED